MGEVMGDDGGAVGSEDCPGSISRHHQGTKLDHELLESGIVKLTDLPSAQQFDVDVPYQGAELWLSGEEGETVVLEHAAELNSSQNLLPLRVVLELLVGMAVVHGPGVGEEEVTKHLVVVLEYGLDGLHLPSL
jgi:hypothetical protein